MPDTAATPPAKGPDGRAYAIDQLISAKSIAARIEALADEIEALWRAEEAP
jgi:hypothetical protein